MARRRRSQRDEAAIASTSESEPAEKRPSQRFLFLTVFMTGAGVIMLEVLGARIAGPYFGVGLYIWTALIAVTLVSLAAGYWLGGIYSDRYPRAGTMYGLIAGAGVAVALIPWLDDPVLVICYETMEIRMGLLCGAFVLFAPALTLLGMVAPFALKLALADLDRAGRTAGALYAVSTMGSVAGAILAGYVLIPCVGVRNTLLVIAAVLLTPPALWFVLARRWEALVCEGALGLFALALVLLEPKPELAADTKVIESRDGIYGEVKVVDRWRSDGWVRWLLIDGTSQTGVYRESNELVSRYTRVLTGFLRLHPPQGKEALVVGLGGGAMLRPLVEAGYTVDVVELDPLVVRTAEEYFDCKPLWRELIVQDARASIRTSDRSYDAVFLDVFSGGSQPFHLFSQEAFEEVNEILNPGGVVGLNTIGFPAGENSVMIKSLFHTASSVFPERQAFIGHPGASPDDLNNVLMFFSETPFTPFDPDVAGDEESVLSEWLDERSFEFDPTEGLLVTDDWNPVDVWSAAVNDSWRKGIFEDWGPAVLGY